MSERERITCRSMLKHVPLRWWPDFKRFVQEGEASAEFLEFYEGDQACQRAFEMVLRRDPIMKALEAALKEIPEEELNFHDDPQLPPASG
jgi:hypothetical protein